MSLLHYIEHLVLFWLTMAQFFAAPWQTEHSCCCCEVNRQKHVRRCIVRMWRDRSWQAHSRGQTVRRVSWRTRELVVQWTQTAASESAAVSRVTDHTGHADRQLDTVHNIWFNHLKGPVACYIFIALFQRRLHKINNWRTRRFLKFAIEFRVKKENYSYAIFTEKIS